MKSLQKIQEQDKKLKILVQILIVSKHITILEMFTSSENKLYFVKPLCVQQCLFCVSVVISAISYFDHNITFQINIRFFLHLCLYMNLDVFCRTLEFYKTSNRILFYSIYIYKIRDQILISSAYWSLAIVRRN